MKYYDNTRISDYKTCPRLFYLRHDRNLTPDYTAIHFIFGLAWHEAMDVLYPAVKAGKGDYTIIEESYKAFVAKWVEEGAPYPLSLEQAENWEPRTPENAKEMLHGYLAARRGFIEECELLAVERPFAVPLYPGDDESNPIYIGRLDKVVKHRTNGIIALEHKTTTAYKKEGGFRSEWIDQWSPNSQIDGYIHAGKSIYGPEFKGVWIDGALVHKTVHDKFKFVPILKAISTLDEWLSETKEWIERIRNDSNSLALSRDGVAVSRQWYPRNTGACGSYSGCWARNICKYTDNPERQASFVGYKVEKWEPFDILKIESLGLQKE